MGALFQLSREVAQDARNTLRLWGRRPWHTCFAILALAIGIGAIPGMAAAVLSGRLLASLVEGAKSVDALTYTATVLFLACIAAAGIWAAPRSIARLDVAEILRSE